jgi:large subunit ribosomal protein L17
MAVSLIKHKRVFTTLAKAKELRKYIEPLITKSKADTTHSRRVVFKNLTDKFAVKELFQEISQKIGDRPGGYTRIIKTGNRLGDNASTCFIELVDYNELMLKDQTPAKAKTRRSKRTGGKGATVTATAEVAETVAPKKKPRAKAEKSVVETPIEETKAEETPVATEVSPTEDKA